MEGIEWNVSNCGNGKNQRKYFLPKNKVEFTNGAYLNVNDVWASDWTVTEGGRVISFGYRGSVCTELIYCPSSQFSLYEEDIEPFFDLQKYDVIASSNDFKLAIGGFLTRKKLRHSRRNSGRHALEYYTIHLDIFHAPNSIFIKCKENQHHKNTLDINDCSQLLHLSLSGNQSWFCMIYFTTTEKVICKIYRFSGTSIKSIWTVNLTQEFDVIFEIGWSFWISQFNFHENLLLIHSFYECVILDLQAKHVCAVPHTHENTFQMISVKDTNFVFTVDMNEIVENEEVLNDVNNIMVDAFKFKGKNLEKVWNLNLRNIESVGDEYIDAVKIHFFSKIKIFASTISRLLVVCPFQKTVLHTFNHDGGLHHTISINWSGEEIFLTGKQLDNLTACNVKVFYYTDEDEKQPLRLSTMAKRVVLVNFTVCQLQTFSLPKTTSMMLGL